MDIDRRKLLVELGKAYDVYHCVGIGEWVSSQKGNVSAEEFDYLQQAVSYVVRQNNRGLAGRIMAIDGGLIDKMFKELPVSSGVA